MHVVFLGRFFCCFPRYEASKQNGQRILFPVFPLNNILPWNIDQFRLEYGDVYPLFFVVYYVAICYTIFKFKYLEFGREK